MKTNDSWNPELNAASLRQATPHWTAAEPLCFYKTGTPTTPRTKLKACSLTPLVLLCALPDTV